MPTFPSEQNLRSINLTENVFFLGEVHRLHMVLNKQMKGTNPYIKLCIVYWIKKVAAPGLENRD